MPSLEHPDLEEASLSAAQELLGEVLSTGYEQGTLFGGYVVHERLGRGGFGVVFRASRVGGDETVAIKLMRGAEHATPEERREFLLGAATAAELEHPGIVRVREVGEWENCPYFTMDLSAGGDLAAAIQLGPATHAQAANWIHKIALAIHHAHSREVLHRDLKPANILLDAQGNPLVADFGSSRRLTKDGHCFESGDGVLSRYMAPEQASGATRSQTRRVDIFSLGVILYELLTGTVPYEGLAFAAWIAELVSDDPVRSPREIEPRIQPDLELVCLKCLEKDPARRYASAELLAEDLELLLCGRRPRHARPDPLLSRGLRWLRRRPLWSATLGGTALLVLVTTVTLFSVQQADRELERAALETNAFIANAQAGALLFQLREFAERTERCAQKPMVATLLSSESRNADSQELLRCARGCETVNVMARDGRLLATWPEPVAPILGRNYAFRDYFQGAKAIAEQSLSGAYLGPAYLSEGNQRFAFSFAAPVLDSSRNWLGNLICSLDVASTIGQLHLKDSVESGRIVALLGPRGRDRLTANNPRPKDFYFIVHPELDRGHEVPLQEPGRAVLERAVGASAPVGDQFSLRWAPPLLLADYHDPLLDPKRSSLAAFAPVGQTGYIVVVETSKEAALHDERVLWKNAWPAAILLPVGLLLLGMGVLSTIRRKRSLETRHGGQTRQRHAESN